eukprot:gene29673-36759_t
MGKARIFQCVSDSLTIMNDLELQQTIQFQGYSSREWVTAEPEPHWTEFILQAHRIMIKLTGVQPNPLAFLTILLYRDWARKSLSEGGKGQKDEPVGWTHTMMQIKHNLQK